MRSFSVNCTGMGELGIIIIIADAQNDPVEVRLVRLWDHAEDGLCVDTVGSDSEPIPAKSIEKRVKTTTSWNVRCPISSPYSTLHVLLAVERDG